MSEKDEKRLTFLARTAAPIGLPIAGIGYWLGDSTAGRSLVISGMAVFLGGGFLILVLVIFSGIANVQNRSIENPRSEGERRNIRNFVTESWHRMRRSISDAGEKTGFRPRSGYDHRVAKKGNLIVSMNESGFAVSAARDGIRVSRALVAAAAVLGDETRKYWWTVGATDSGPLSDSLLLLPLNKDRVHTRDVNVPWHACSSSEAYDVLLWRRDLRSKIEAQRREHVRQNGDAVLLSWRPIFYELSGEYRRVYESLVSNANRAKVGAVWYDRETWENLGIERWKGNSGSHFTVDRKRAGVWFRAGSGLEVTRDVVSFRLNSQEYAILPDVLVVNGKTLHSFANIQILSEIRGYVIPENKIPRGSLVKGYTWEFVNKNGSPDMRYSENERLAIIDVIEVAVASNGKVVFTVIFSEIETGKRIVQSLTRLCELARMKVN